MSPNPCKLVSVDSISIVASSDPVVVDSATQRLSRPLVVSPPRISRDLVISLPRISRHLVVSPPRPLVVSFPRISRDFVVSSSHTTSNVISGFSPSITPSYTLPTTEAISELHGIISTLNSVSISTASLRRHARDFIRAALPGFKPAAMRPAMPDVEAMVSPIIFTAGASRISDCPLRPDLMYEDHLRYHANCSPTCYIHRMTAVAANGWRLTFRHDRPIRICSRSFNHKPFVQFGSLSDIALEKQFLNSGACAPLPLPLSTNSRLRPVFSPLLSVIRNSDLWRASVAGVRVQDGESLAAANALLEPPIKLRICLDVSSSGINDAMPDFPFSYAALEDGLALITPGSWTAKIDLTAMFNSIGLASQSRRYFTFRDSKGIAYGYSRAFFGCKLFPAVASGFMAEIQHILSAEGVPCISYMDDF